MTERAFDKIKSGLNEAIETVRRRGGPDYDFPCNDPNIIECAIWECQKECKFRLPSPASS